METYHSIDVKRANENGSNFRLKDSNLVDNSKIVRTI